MTWLDYAVLGVAAVSLLWGVWRGLVREIISVLGWVLAFLAANLFAGPLAPSLPAAIPTPELRVLTAFLAVFIGTLAVTTLAGLLFSKLVRAIGLGSLDRVLGACFGLARALLIAVAFALLAGLTSVPRMPVWTDSVSGPVLGRVALALKPWLPETLTGRLRYD